MALYRRKEISLLLGINATNLRQLISRNKIICNGKLVDTSSIVTETTITDYLEKKGFVRSDYDKLIKCIPTHDKVKGKMEIVIPTPFELYGKDWEPIIKEIPPKKRVYKPKTKPKPKPKSDNKEKPKPKAEIKEKQPSKPVVPVLTKEQKAERERMKEKSILDLRKKRAEADKVEREAAIKRIEAQQKAGEVIPLDLCLLLIKSNNKTIFSNMSQEIDVQAQTYAKTREELAIIKNDLQKSLERTIEKAKNELKEGLDNIVLDFKNKKGRGQSF